MRNMKKTNEYQLAIPFYDKIPKAVLAAIAYSFASRIIEVTDPMMVEQAIWNEWDTLYHNDIVPQEPRY